MRTILRRITLPIKYLLLAFSFLLPRKKNIWCFGATFGGNAKYLFIYLRELAKDEHRCIWISEGQEVDRLKSLGFETYERWSLKGIWFCLIAGAYFFNSYPANVNLYTIGRTKRVNLWHGVGLKKFDRQIKTGPLAKLYQSTGIVNELRYLNFRLKPDIMLSTSPLQTQHFIEAVGLPESHIIEGVYPRCEIFNKNKNDIISFIRVFEPLDTINLVTRIKQFSYVYIYMPTFRDSGDDFIKDCGFDFDMVNDVLEKNNRFLILKMHPDSNLDIHKEYSNIMIMSKNVDIYPVLPFTHCLITDFSSIYYDYILMKDKHIILFIPDYENFINNSRDLEFPYDEYAKGITAKCFTELIALFDMDISKYNMPDLDVIRNTFWAPKHNNMAQLLNAIDQKLN